MQAPRWKLPDWSSPQRPPVVSVPEKLEWESPFSSFFDNLKSVSYEILKEKGLRPPESNWKLELTLTAKEKKRKQTLV